MKRMLIGLAAFTVILALSNLATAFIAASLAKDTAVSQPSSTTSIPTLTDKAGHDLATLNKGIAIDATTVEKAYTPQNDAQRALFGIEQNGSGTTEESGAPSFTFLSNSIGQDKAESIFQACLDSTPSTITHMCNGVKTISRVGCDYAARAENRFYTFSNGLRFLCDLYTDNMRAADTMGDCLVTGLACGSINRVASQCGSEKPNHVWDQADGASTCSASCECSSGCCASFTTPVCLPEAPEGLFCI